MIRPMSLLRDDDDDTPRRFQAPATNITNESLDCGLSCMGGFICCAGQGCQRLATPVRFLFVLVLCGLFQGALQEYFRNTALQAADEFGYNDDVIEWLLVSSEILTGLLAMGVAFWGMYYHRAAWLGGLIVLQAITAVLVIVPKLTHTHGGGSKQVIMHTVSNMPLCTVDNTPGVVTANEDGEFEPRTEPEFCMSTLVMLFVLQLGAGLGNSAYFCLGLTYVDDNVREHNSPALISLALAARFFGPQLGSITVWSLNAASASWWIGWPPLAGVLLITGFLLALFPRRLMNVVVRQAAASILNIATSRDSTYQSRKNTMFADNAIVPTLKRIFSNKILLLNIGATVFLLTGLVNFMYLEPYYLQAKFFIPVHNIAGFGDPWTSRLTATLLRPFVVALCVFVSGLVISKLQPRSRFVAAWMIAASVVIAIVLTGSIFLSCSSGRIAGEHRGRLGTPYCSSHCNCPVDTPFMPVCDHTGVDVYYSPCHAGCVTGRSINSVLIFENCSCSDVGVVTLGGCDASSCQTFWSVYQAKSVLITGLLGTILLGNILISFRSVLTQDKAMAIAVELTSAGILVHVPGKLVYNAIAEATCQYRGSLDNSCFLHSAENFGLLITVTTIVLVCISIVLNSLVLFFVSSLYLYGEEDDNIIEREMVPILPSGDNDNGGRATLAEIDIDSFIDDSVVSHNGRNQNNIPTRSITPNQTQHSAIADEPELNFEERRPSRSPPKSPTTLLNSDL